MHLSGTIFSGPGEAVNLPPVDLLLLWRDPVARTGEEAMAADEVLLEWDEYSVMRVYDWKEPTVTYGFFDSEEEASRIFPDPGLHFVRRWTGGGIVDHRADIPFTLALRSCDREGRPQSAALYRWIHGGLARVLRSCGVECVLLDGDAPDGGRACFSSPVTSDLVLPDGSKLAGGGQRRAKCGVLHQGSIQNCTLPEGWDLQLAERLSLDVKLLSSIEPFPGFQDKVDELVRTKYATEAWRYGGHRRPHH